MSAATGPPRRSAVTRDHVLAVAHELFYWQGIRATGIDRVAAEAGVAATTLYRLFGSKDGLIAAYVERAADDHQRWFSAATATGGTDPRKRVLAVFDALVEQVQPDQCRGCPFQMALTEIPDTAMPAHQRAAALKSWVRDQLRQMTDAMLVDDPAALADQLALVIEGVYASVHAVGNDGPARRARALAEVLLGDGGVESGESSAH